MDGEAVLTEMSPNALTDPGLSAVDRQLDLLNDAMAGMETSSFSPFRLFPTECMAEILQWYCNQADERDIFNTSEGPWLLTHVCRLWRNIALSCCQFSPRPYPSNWRDTIRTRIALTKSHPIAFSLSATSASGNDDDYLGLVGLTQEERRQNHKECLALLMCHSKRWRHVYLHVGYHYLKIFSLEVSGRLPLLRALDAYISNGIFDDAAPVTAFETAPLLRELELSNCGSPVDIRLPLAQLTDVKITRSDEDLSLKDTFQFFSQSPLLRSFSTNTQPSADAAAADLVPQEVLTASHLRYLSSDRFEWSFWRRLRTPLLEELRIDLSQEINILFTFLRTAQCSGLVRLSVNLCYSDATVEECFTMIELAPALEELFIESKSSRWYMREMEEEEAATEYFDALVHGLSVSALLARSHSLRCVSIDDGRPPDRVDSFDWQPYTIYVRPPARIQTNFPYYYHY